MNFTQAGEIITGTGRVKTAIAILFYLLDEYDQCRTECSMEQLAIAVGGTPSNISNVCNRLKEGGLINIQYRTTDGSVSDTPRRRASAKPYIHLTKSVLSLYRRQ